MYLALSFIVIFLSFILCISLGERHKDPTLFWLIGGISALISQLIAIMPYLVWE